MRRDVLLVAPEALEALEAVTPLAEATEDLGRHGRGWLLLMSLQILPTTHPLPAGHDGGICRSWNLYLLLCLGAATRTRIWSCAGGGQSACYCARARAVCSRNKWLRFWTPIFWAALTRPPRLHHRCRNVLRHSFPGHWPRVCVTSGLATQTA